MNPIPENLLMELRAEMADVRSLLIEALGDFTIYQEGLLKLHEREKRIAKFYRSAFISATVVLALFIGFGSAQLLSTGHVVHQTKDLAGQTKDLAEQIKGIQTSNRSLLEEVDCVVRAAAFVPAKDLPAAYAKCVQPRKGTP